MCSGTKLNTISAYGIHDIFGQSSWSSFEMRSMLLSRWSFFQFIWGKTNVTRGYVTCAKGI